ncbi:MAG: hypothetical protein JJU48_03975 [Methylophaga sp.]|nr:hypothetical protein [Methylophaga sp.]
MQDGGGVGAWPIGVSGVITLLVAGLAYRYRADYSITRTDRLFMVLAILSLAALVFHGQSAVGGDLADFC